jgi:hypothetical protein
MANKLYPKYIKAAVTGTSTNLTGGTAKILKFRMSDNLLTEYTVNTYSQGSSPFNSDYEGEHF